MPSNLGPSAADYRLALKTRFAGVDVPHELFEGAVGAYLLFGYALPNVDSTQVPIFLMCPILPAMCRAFQNVREFARQLDEKFLLRHLRNLRAQARRLKVLI
jgi:hypothetical protein